MDRFSCSGYLDIKVDVCKDDPTHQKVRLALWHDAKHVPYVNVDMPPATSEFIREHLYTAPVTLVPEVTHRWPQVSSKQVYTAWRLHTEILWKRQNDQKQSARELLKEFETAGCVDRWELEVPEGVEAFAWGMSNIARQLKDQVIEIAFDATCKTFFSLKA